MTKHLLLPVGARHFDLWLELLEQTAREVYPAIATGHFILRGRRIADNLRLAVANHKCAMHAERRRLLSEPSMVR